MADYRLEMADWCILRWDKKICRQKYPRWIDCFSTLHLQLSKYVVEMPPLQVCRSIMCIMHTVYCILNTEYCILYTAYCILYTVYVGQGREERRVESAE
jgi:hypothetical protein